jgi:hypothetical protein
MAPSCWPIRRVLSKLIVVLNDWVTEFMLWLVVVIAMAWGYIVGADLVSALCKGLY